MSASVNKNKFLDTSNITAESVKIQIPRYQHFDSARSYNFAVSLNGSTTIRLCTPPVYIPYGSRVLRCKLLPPAHDIETKTFIDAILAIDEGIKAGLNSPAIQGVLKRGCGYRDDEFGKNYEPSVNCAYLKPYMSLHRRSDCVNFTANGTFQRELHHNSEVRMLIKLSHVWIHSHPKNPEHVSSIGCTWEICQVRALTVPKCDMQCCAIPGVHTRDQSTQVCSLDLEESKPVKSRRIPRGGIAIISASALKSVKLRRSRKRGKKSKSKIKKLINDGKAKQAFQMVTVDILRRQRSVLRRSKRRPRPKPIPGRPRITFPSFADLKRKRIVKRVCPSLPFLEHIRSNHK